MCSSDLHDHRLQRPGIARRLAFAAQAALDDAEARLALTLADGILQRLALSAGDWT